MPIDPSLAQAIVNPVVPDIVGQFRAGQERRRTRDIRSLTGQVLAGEGGMQELQKLSPETALKLGEHFRSRDAASLDATIRDSRILENMIESGDIQGAYRLLSQRNAEKQMRGEDVTQTQQMLQLLQQDPTGRSVLQQISPFNRAIEEESGRTLEREKLGMRQQELEEKRARPGKLIAGVDAEGKPAYFERDPSTGKLVKVPGAIPPPGSSQRISVDSEGNISFEQGKLAPVAEKKTIGAIEDKLLSGQQTIDRLSRIKRDFDPDFLRYFGGGKGSISAKIRSYQEKLGGELPEEAKQIVKNRRRFTQNVNAEFNAYRKLITGAAASVQELESLKKAMIDTSLSPSEFEGAFEAYSEEVKRSNRIMRRLHREGVSGSLNSSKSEASKQFDELFMTGADDDIETRGNELSEQGFSDEEVDAILSSEGY